MRSTYLNLYSLHLFIFLSSLKHNNMRCISISIILLTISFLASAQEAKQMQFFPATESYLPGLNVYSAANGDFKQYYVENGRWVRNNEMPDLKTKYAKGAQRIQYLPGSTEVSPNLFVYSTTTGEFQFFYLNNGEWKLNTLLPSGDLNFKSKDVRMEFTSGSEKMTAYIFAYATDGEELTILNVANDAWTEIDYFPTMLSDQ